MKIRLLIAIIALSLIAVLTVQAQDALTITPVQEAVISASTNRADWDGRYTDPGAVLYHDGQFHMFRNGFQAWPASVQIGYLTSPDGITWTEVTEDPVLHTDDVPYAGDAALASSALVEPDGTWVLYFYTWDSSLQSTSSAIGRATASDPLGPWVVDPDPVLVPGAAGSWDSQQVLAPRVIRTMDEYRMYYSGNASDPGSSAIGLATSADGITWTKYDDPDTTDAPFAESDPVLVSGEEGPYVHQPIIFETAAGYGMVYRNMPMIPPRDSVTLMVTTSADGITWERGTGDPLWTTDTIESTRGFWWTAGLAHENTLYLYVEVGDVRGRTNIHVGTAALDVNKNNVGLPSGSPT